MKTFRTILGAGLVMATAGWAAAQPSPTPSAPDRWAPWMGCWQITDESIQDAAALLSELAGTSSAPASRTPNALVCVAPSPDGGATMTTIVNDKPVLVETVVADGSRRPLTDDKCRGWQQAEWSQLGARVYAQAEITCGDQPARTVSGLATIVTGPRWLDIQVVESEGQKSMRVRRYRRAANQKHATAVPSTARNLATMPIGGKLTMADIKEASAKVPTEALQAAVLELGAGGYDLNARRLRELDAVGVPDSVIDLMVAMSFPERFVVERRASVGGYGGGYGGGGYGGYGPGLDPMWGAFSMWPYYYADPFYYSSLYSPFGYRSWGYYDPYYYRGPGVIILEPGSPGMSPEPSGNGRVVDGRGYTRIRRNEPDPATRTGNGSGWGTSSTGAGSSGSGAGTSGGVSSGGYSSGGGSGSSGGRTAVPRPPG
ncbi:MAG TPA: hypothetical protein VMO26_00385 [Vicinamibacterales bacterium]|nr:hypothetical protein [Vicinamibacterales bacterium]